MRKQINNQPFDLSDRCLAGRGAADCWLAAPGAGDTLDDGVELFYTGPVRAGRRQDRGGSPRCAAP